MAGLNWYLHHYHVQSLQVSDPMKHVAPHALGDRAVLYLVNPMRGAILCLHTSRGLRSLNSKAIVRFLVFGVWIVWDGRGYIPFVESGQEASGLPSVSVLLC